MVCTYDKDYDRINDKYEYVCYECLNGVKNFNTFNMESICESI